MANTELSFELKGITPLLMHADDIDAADVLMEWRKDPGNKNISVKGDDRSPAWTWQTYCYSDGVHLAIPQQNIAVALRQAGAQISLKGNKSYKEVSQSGLLITTEFCEFRCQGKQVPIASLKALKDKAFSEQSTGVQKFGFKLFSKRATISPTAKHIRVRPRFDDWSVKGRVLVAASEITPDILKQLFNIAGRGGLGDWRPSSKKSPGPFGMFTATVK